MRCQKQTNERLASTIDCAYVDQQVRVSPANKDNQCAIHYLPIGRSGAGQVRAHLGP